MPCRICNTCDLYIENTSEHECPVCGEKTSFLQTKSLPDDWWFEVELALATRLSPTQQAFQDWKRRRLEKFGFGGAFLDVLVDTLDDVNQARRLIDRGCDVETAARILI